MGDFLAERSVAFFGVGKGGAVFVWREKALRILCFGRNDFYDLVFCVAFIFVFQLGYYVD